jgi:hypothetical protein
MIEDMPQNSEVPHIMGITTVLIHSSTIDQPVQETMKRWTEQPARTDHMTKDLAEVSGGGWCEVAPKFGCMLLDSTVLDTAVMGPPQPHR